LDVVLVRGVIAVHFGHHVLAAAVLHIGHLTVVLLMPFHLHVLGMRIHWLRRRGRGSGGEARRDHDHHFSSPEFE
jgi:hypothetical protein